MKTHYHLPRILRHSAHALIITGILAASLLSAQAQIGKNWRLRSPLPSSEYMTDVTAVGTHLLAVGRGTAFMRSGDNGVTWTAGRMLATPNNPYNDSTLAVDGTTLLAATGDGFFTSTDEGASWSHLSTDLPTYDQVSNVVRAGSQWAALQSHYNDSGGYNELNLIVSTDGTHWTALGTVPGAAASVSLNIHQMLWNGASFVLVGNTYNNSTATQKGQILHTVDGTAWDVAALTDAADAYDVSDVVWSSSLAQFLAVAGGSSDPLTYTSPDGVTWTRNVGAVYAQSVVWTGSQFIAAGSYAATSPDGLTWTYSTTMPDNFSVNALAWDGAQVVAVGPAGRAYTSPSGDVWTQRSPTGPVNDFKAIATNGSGVFVAADAAGQPYRSTDGDAWTAQTGAAYSLINGLVWDGAKFVGVAGEVTATSTDGITWSDNPTFDPGDNAVALGFSGSTYVAVGQDSFYQGCLYSSTDGGASWTRRTLPGGVATLNTVSRLGFGAAALWVAAGDSGAILTSPDGTTWTKRSTGGTFMNFRSLASSGTIAVAVGVNGGTNYFTSTNGTVWTQRSMGNNNYVSLRTVVWAGTNFAAVGENGDAMTSTDGLTWNRRTLPTVNNLAAMIWTGTQALAVGDGGTVVSSDLVPTVQFATPAQSVFETEGSAAVQVTLDLPAAGTITIPLTVGGTATGADFSGVPSSIVFNTGEQTKSFNITIVDDTDVDPGETITLTLGTTSGVRLGAANPHTITIIDNDSPPAVQFTNTAFTVQEHAGKVGVGLELSWPAAATVTVPITVTGSADGSDFNGVPANVVFNAGDTSAFITINVTDDTAVETDETVILTLGAPSGGTLGSATVFTLTIQDNDPGTTPARRWTLRQPLPSADDFSAITSIPASVIPPLGRQVIVQHGGAVVTSDDNGATWTQRSSPMVADTWIYNVFWTGSRLIATGSGGQVLTSPDGIAWAAQRLPGATSSTEIDGGASSPSRQVLVGYDFGGSDDLPLIFTSADTVHWSTATLPAGLIGDLNSVEWTGTQFVAVGDHYAYDEITNKSLATSIVLTSPDGRVWTQRTSAVLAGVNLNSIVWAGDKLVIFEGGKNCYTSPDGITWTKRALGALGNIGAGIWNGTKLLAAGDVIATSSNGIAWTEKASPTKSMLAGMTWTGSTFILITETGIYTSPDATTWSKRSSGAESYSSLFGAVWSGTQFVAVGEFDELVGSSLIFTSPDGVAWTRRTPPTKTLLTSVAWSGGTFAAVGFNGTILTSTDGITWATRASGTTLQLHEVIWAGNQFVAVGGNETDEVNGNPVPGGSIALTSPNGTTWTRRTVPTIQSLESVAFTGTQFVAVGRSTFDGGALPAVILTSPDAINWTPRSSGLTNHDLQRVVWNGSLFVATHDGFGFLKSPDGITWTPATGVPPPPPSVDNDLGLVGIAWTGTEFVAVGDLGTVLTSTDGNTWVLRQSEVRSRRVWGVAWNGSTLVAVGSHASIQTSGAVTPPPLAVDFDQGSANYSEAAGVANILVRLNAPPTVKVTVPYTLNPGVGMVLSGPTADVTIPLSPLVFNPGETSKFLSVVIKNDTVDESFESVDIVLGTPTNAVLGTTHPSFTLGILDDDTAPAIAPGGNPTHALLPLGAPLTLIVNATGGAPLAYQWKKGTATIAGATGPVLYVPKVALTDAGAYTCTITNSVRTITNTAVTATTVAAEVGVYENTHKRIANFAGKDAVLTQSFAGNGLTLKWYKNGSMTEFPAGAPHVTYDATKKTLTLKVLVGGDAGSYQCQVLQAASSLLTNANLWDVAVVPVKPTLDAITLPGGQIGVYYSYTVPPGAGSSEIATWSATSLPTGLSINPLTGEITGYPSVVAANKAVTITATNGVGPTSKATTINVLALPPGLGGSCVGFMAREPIVNRNLGARIALTTAPNGFFTGSYTIGTDKAQSFTGQAIADTATTAHGSTTLLLSGRLVTFAFTYDSAATANTGAGSVSLVIPGVPGTFTAPIKTWRALTGPTLAGYVGRHNFALKLTGGDIGNQALPQGHGYGSATVTATGVVTWGGKLADGQVISGTSNINTDGTCTCYTGVNGGLGSFLAQPKLSPNGNDTTIIDLTDASWGKLHDTAAAGARNYPAGWAPLHLLLQGSRYKTPGSTEVVMGMTYTSFSTNASLTFAEGGVGLPAPIPVDINQSSPFGGGSPSPNVDVNLNAKGVIDGIYGFLNQRSVKLTVTPGTGLFSGTLDMTGTLPNGVKITRTGVKYEGQIARIIGNSPEFQGVGFVTLPKMPDANLSPTPPASSTPILSGRVELTPLP